MSGEFGIVVPKGDPGALCGAASTWDATADALAGPAQTSAWLKLAYTTGYSG